MRYVAKVPSAVKSTKEFLPRCYRWKTWVQREITFKYKKDEQVRVGLALVEGSTTKRNTTSC